MTPWLSSFAVAIVSASLAAGVDVAQARATCASLTSLTIPDVKIASATVVPAGPFSSASGRGGGTIVPAFCRVTAIATPSADSNINLEVWIPTANWNGKLLGTANGGFGGSLPYGPMAAGLARGYATVGTDTGHTGDQLEFGLGHPEKIVDWGYRAIHVMTETAKLVIRSDRGRFPDRSYFDGCSTGGQQGLSEAQRYPADYDGIVAGDPGHNRVRLILGFLWGWLALHGDDGKLVLPAVKLATITKAAVAACDANDGLTDGLIADPVACHFDPSTLLCKGAEDNACLTVPQVAAVKKVYDGAKNPRTHEQIFPGWARGSEQGWGGYLLSPAEPSRIGFFRYFTFHDPAWDIKTFDWDRDVAFVDTQVPALSATSTNLSAFKARGGKLVMYTGLADPVVPPQDTIEYYDAVTKAMGDAATRSFFRFFPVPGMGHCTGGAGAVNFDALGALERWVEHGDAPASLAGSHSTGGLVDRTRPLCGYPARARYKGAGSIDDAANFTCTTAAPDRRPPDAARPR